MTGWSSCRPRRTGAAADRGDLSAGGAPSDGLDLDEFARRTQLFSGADLRSVVEQAIDQVIEEALSTGREPPLRMSHLLAALATARPATLDWLNRARAYVEFANQSERYADIAAYFKTREVRRRLAR